MSHNPNPSVVELKLKAALALGASDIHLAANNESRIRVAGKLESLSNTAGCVTDTDLREWLVSSLTDEEQQRFETRGSFDGALTFQNASRLRFNVFRSSGHLAIAFRKLEDEFRELSALGLSDELYRICDLKYGLVLVAGPTGSGKSTTLATLIHRINASRAAHIITIEDPIEYVHKSQQSLVNQRQVGVDAPNFHQALIDSLRQDPDVILIGEIRDLDTIRTAITAAETGHLVLASVHASDCVGAVERLISAFPADEQNMIQRLLGMVVRCVIAQHLILAEANAKSQSTKSVEQMLDTNIDSQRVLVSEVMWGTTAISNLIAAGQTRQIASMMESGASEGMQTLDACLAQLLKRRKISESTARSLAKNPTLVVERARR